MSLLPSTRQSLLTRLKDPGDILAWTEFSRIYEGSIYATARRWGMQHADACDLVQNVLQSVAKQMDNWNARHAVGSFRGWLRTVTRNQLINCLQSRRNRLQIGSNTTRDWNQIADDRESIDASLEIEYQREVFQMAAEIVRDEFEEKTWRAFWLCTVESFETHEVASTLNSSQSAVYVAKCRVLARLRIEVTRIIQAEQE
jgi:RNA polymerase sigma factor (sigma-70 family)